MDDEKYIKRAYFTPRSPGSFSALSGFLKNRKYKDKKYVENALSTLKTYSLHKPIRKNFPRRKVVVPFLGYLHAVDLIDYRRHSRANAGYRYILVIVEGLSRFLWTIPLKRKSANDLEDAVRLFLKTLKTKPKFWWADAGTEFFNSKVKQLLNKNSVTLYHTYSKLKSSIAEAFVKKVKVKLARVFTHTKKYNWIDHLKDITLNINDSYNSSIKMPASKVTHANESEVWHNLYNSLVISKPVKPIYRPSDLVRISRKKLAFTKGYERNFSLEIFRIKEVKNTAGAPTYSLESLAGEPVQGSYYNQDLVKVIGGINTDD